MRILVTGREGQVARSLAQCGAEREHELIFASRPDLDLADPDSIVRVVEAARPDLIISAAAYTAVDRAEDEPELAMTINGTAPGVLARAAARQGAAILHLSTDYVFDGQLDRPWREDDPVAPLSVYGQTKLAGERAVAAAGAPYAILRTAWVYSPYGSNFVKTMLRLATGRDEVSVVDDQCGNPTSALDIAEALLTIADRWQRSPHDGAGAVYHLAGQGETNWAEFARAVFTRSVARGGPGARVRNIPTNAYPTRAARPANSRLDCARLAHRFGIVLPPWATSLDRVVERLFAAAVDQLI